MRSAVQLTSTFDMNVFPIFLSNFVLQAYPTTTIVHLIEANSDFKIFLAAALRTPLEQHVMIVLLSF
ncbi:MAG: hypothetical protein IPJ43_21190 [Saprospiraceae bacterium]|nr:hypothetical protein [Saprospiraceae bacterium]